MNKLYYCKECNLFASVAGPLKRGECRRHSPRLVFTEEGGSCTEWPVVESTDYCGDWEIKSCLPGS